MIYTTLQLHWTWEEDTITEKHKINHLRFFHIRFLESDHAEKTGTIPFHYTVTQGGKCKVQIKGFSETMQTWARSKGDLYTRNLWILHDFRWFFVCIFICLHSHRMLQHRCTAPLYKSTSLLSTNLSICLHFTTRSAPFEGTFPSWIQFCVVAKCLKWWLTTNWSFGEQKGTPHVYIFNSFRNIGNSYTS